MSVPFPLAGALAPLRDFELDEVPLLEDRAFVLFARGLLALFGRGLLEPFDRALLELFGRGLLRERVPADFEGCFFFAVPLLACEPLRDREVLFDRVLRDFVAAITASLPGPPSWGLQDSFQSPAYPAR